jgi:E3 ubiquitin-protein ligase RNF14
MAAAATAGASSSQTPPEQPHLSRYRDFSSSSQAADARAVTVSCDGGGGEEEVDVLNLDSPWVSAAEAESILEEAAVAAGRYPGAEKDAEVDEIRANQERQQDEVRLALLTY